MDYRRLTDEPLRTYAIVFDEGDEASDGLLRFARAERLDAASFTAIGAFRRATLGFFDLDRREYERIPIEEQIEVVSLVGDVTAAPDGREPKVHAHVVVARRDGAALGGHLLDAVVRPTLEVVVTETPAHLRRREDPDTGLALIDLERTTQAGTSAPSAAAGHEHGG